MCFLQKAATNNAKTMVDATIAEKFDIKVILSSTSSNTIRIADLGCSVGPNTFTSVQNIIDAVQNKYLQSEGPAYRIPEFHVFFNDHVSNDFNVLFTSLPPDRQYFAAGVPGSFYSRLFPESSLHFVHSSYAIQWLSKVPEELLNKNSKAWNKGRIHYTSAPDEVIEVYAAQFAKDMTTFLEARSKELVVGGMMVLIMPGIANGIAHSDDPVGLMFNFLGSSLIDMVKEGLISEDQVDSFNIPVYTASAREITKLVEKNGCFSIEIIDLTLSRSVASANGQDCTMHMRAGMEGIISKHFGSEIIDELFDRFHKKTEELLYLLESRTKEGSQLLVILKRK
ncbi:S-adenosylmethionine-dependent methyltransferase [Quillaja saponaria]|uniref:S-adenosylmethionine-dependent methyltransferase n=1 Tax=Quillaja saponaria TaxID=32244 RepID=A0AAD7KNK4_QUISA|nr:S-adenosylmethionine-dependent methyltransferase [Quillaja saponaria]